MKRVAAAAIGLAALGTTGASAQAPPPAAQNPSPMVESTRAHERLTEREFDGTKRTFSGPAGRPVEVFIPRRVKGDRPVDMVIHFLGAGWIPAHAVAALGAQAVAVVVNLGAGSGAYQRPFTDPAVFDLLMVQAEQEITAATGKSTRLGRVVLSAFSAGHGAVRIILREPRHFARVDAVLLLDGMHTSYVPEGTPLATGGTLDTMNLSAFAAFARAAMRGEKRFVVTHSEIFPGTFASTTETADWIIGAIGLRRTAVLRWGPRRMQQLSEVRSGKLDILGYAGNSAPDHIDHLHATPELLAFTLGGKRP